MELQQGEHALGELAVQNGACIEVYPDRRGAEWTLQKRLVAQGRMGHGKHKPLRFTYKNGVILVTLQGRFSQATVLDRGVFERWLDTLPVILDVPNNGKKEVVNPQDIAAARTAVRRQVYRDESSEMEESL